MYVLVPARKRTCLQKSRALSHHITPNELDQPRVRQISSTKKQNGIIDKTEGAALRAAPTPVFASCMLRFVLICLTLDWSNSFG